MSQLANPELIKVVILLASSVTIVPLFKRLGLGSVLGYLVAGCLIGPSVFGIEQDPTAVVHLAELGVVMFLLLSGLKCIQNAFGQCVKLFSAEVCYKLDYVVAYSLFSGIYLLGLTKEVAFIVGMGFTLSSTAIVMQSLEERGAYFYVKRTTRNFDINF